MFIQSFYYFLFNSFRSIHSIDYIHSIHTVDESDEEDDDFDRGDQQIFDFTSLIFTKYSLQIISNANDKNGYM